MTKKDLFLELAKPNNYKSRWVNVSEFVGKYKDLQLGNGGSWCRGSSSLAQEFIVEFDKSLTTGNKIDRIRLNGENEYHKLSQNIREDIKKELSKKRCIILGTHRSCDHKTEVDHKDGRKNDLSVMNPKTQKIENFQPLSKPANDAKRQFCIECKNTGLRYDAKKLGYTTSVVEGDLKYNEKLGCKGCFWFDPIAFRQKLKLTGN
ncbi:MAG: restriction endonuclease [Candidatus Gracilibacteria bacterium]|nr:restriction endonuclease [Candidatus Gracilibacteria bacterium]